MHFETKDEFYKILEFPYDVAIGTEISKYDSSVHNTHYYNVNQIYQEFGYIYVDGLMQKI